MKACADVDDDEDEEEEFEGEGGNPVFGGMKMGSPKHTSRARNTSLRC